MTTVPPGITLQKISSVKTDTGSISATTTPLQLGPTVAITPQFSTSKLRITYSFVLGAANASGRLVFGTLYNETSGSALVQGDAASSRSRVTNADFVASNGAYITISGEYEITASSTSARTYSIRVSANAADTVYINRSSADTDAAGTVRAASWITVEEISN